MISARFVTIHHWPGTPTAAAKQKRAPFRSTYPKTLDLLERELAHLKARDILIQAFFSHEDIRNDGWPKGGRAPRWPGIIVTFLSGSSTSSLSFPCDTYSSWEDNLRAIALALSALRAIRRYGVGRTTEQYRGFAQLPAASDKRADAVVYFAKLLARSEQEIRSDPSGAYKIAAAITHPDRNSGDRSGWDAVQEHWAALK